MVERDFLAAQGGPVLLILVRARAEAAEAIATLCTADPNDTKLIIALQNDAQRYRDLLRWLSAIIADGKDAVQTISEEDREDLREAIGLTESQDQ